MYIYIYIYTENYHEMWWFWAVVQSGDCFVLIVCAHSNTITWWEKRSATITSLDRCNFPRSILLPRTISQQPFTQQHMSPSRQSRRRCRRSSVALDVNKQTMIIIIIIIMIILILVIIQILIVMIIIIMILCTIFLHFPTKSTNKPLFRIRSAQTSPAWCTEGEGGDRRWRRW